MNYLVGYSVFGKSITNPNPISHVYAGKMALLLGKRECNTASDTEQALLRLLTPVPLI